MAPEYFHDKTARECRSQIFRARNDYHKRVSGKFAALPAGGKRDGQSPIENRRSAIENLIDSLASRSLALSGLPVHFAASQAAQFTHLPSSEQRIGSSSIMN